MELPSRCSGFFWHQSSQPLPLDIDAFLPSIRPCPYLDTTSPPSWVLTLQARPPSVFLLSWSCWSPDFSSPGNPSHPTQTPKLWGLVAPSGGFPPPCAWTLTSARSWCSVKGHFPQLGQGLPPLLPLTHTPLSCLGSSDGFELNY